MGEAPEWLAPAASPDVRYGHPGLRSLDGGYAPPSMAPLAANAGSTTWATHSFSTMLQKCESSIQLRGDDVEAAEHGDDVGERVAADQLREEGEVQE